MARKSIAKHALVLGVSILLCVGGALKGNPAMAIVVVLIYLIWLTYGDDEEYSPVDPE